MPKLNPTLSAFAIFAIFAALYLLLPSQHFTAVDGSVRCLDAYFANSLHFHGNNHLLYPFWMGLWEWILSSIGFPAKDPFSFMRQATALNSLLGAGNRERSLW
jgi:hypothetical protein